MRIPVTRPQPHIIGAEDEVTEATLASEIQWQCQSLFLRFMQSLDAGNAEEAVALLAPTAVWHRQGRSVVGPTAVRNVINRRAGDRVIRHHLSNIVVTSHGPLKATSLAYYAAYVHEGPALPRVIRGPAFVGDYYVEYTKFGGHWLISLLRADRIFTTSSQV